MRNNVTDEEIILACNNALTMSKACSTLAIHPNTFRQRAKKLGVYKPNPGGKGTRKPNEKKIIPLDKILEGKHPEYQTFKLKLRLFEKGIKENKCEECGITNWNGKSINCELDHINGNSNDHRLENLKILCPNCHSQTSTFRAKNKMLR